MKFNIDQAAVVGHLRALEANKAIKMLNNALLTNKFFLSSSNEHTQRPTKVSFCTTGIQKTLNKVWVSL